MKIYERKLKIEIITVIVTISYFFMVRDDNTMLERGILLALFASWIVFALAYHLWDLKRRGLTIKKWIETFRRRYKGGGINLSHIFKFTKVLCIMFSIIILLTLIFALMLGVKEKVSINDLVFFIINTIIFLIASLECVAFSLACIVRLNDKKKI